MKKWAWFDLLDTNGENLTYLEGYLSNQSKVQNEEPIFWQWEENQYNFHTYCIKKHQQHPFKHTTTTLNFSQKLVHKKDRQQEAGQTQIKTIVNKNKTLRALGGGLMEFSFNPSAPSSNEKASTKKVQQRPKPPKTLELTIIKSSFSIDTSDPL
ncbi:hypothetical protein MJO28_013764 [Puccinia striiformis f. sp. tritici]|uniref:Uncharacterized protein n=1 Tax=Puccinia striiformis f. sp. tritici TaxID=168172 RepID=A0ACC0DVE3_9BASI|nr:hypothetical protein MJO28_013764 [Puccinia striiformis f. sp. tritici]